MEYHRIYMGKRISLLRRAKGLTQEQLAAELCVSPAAVSKWERDIAVPGVELLWMLADHFACSIDELVGRRQEQMEQMGIYEEESLYLIAIADDLLRCSEASRCRGLLAMEQEIADFQGGSEFLPFAIRYILQGFGNQMDVGRIMELLRNYSKALPAEQTEGPMVTAALEAIVSGESADMVREIVASYIGMEYWEKMAGDRVRQRTREDVLARYKEPCAQDTGLLEPLAQLGDFEIQTILRNLENSEFAAAMRGVSGAVAMRFLSNLSDRVLTFIGEDIDNWQGTEEDILAAQRKILEIRKRCGGGGEQKGTVHEM